MSDSLLFIVPPPPWQGRGGPTTSAHAPPHPQKLPNASKTDLKSLEEFLPPWIQIHPGEGFHCEGSKLSFFAMGFCRSSFRCATEFLSSILLACAAALLVRVARPSESPLSSRPPRAPVFLEGWKCKRTGSRPFSLLFWLIRSLHPSETSPVPRGAPQISRQPATAQGREPFTTAKHLLLVVDGGG